MDQLKKYLPYILGMAAILTLYFNYDQWRMMKKEKCSCQEGSETPGMID
ncbi:MAG: hypothetical protein AAF242_18330 [Bacteroidota bacterium]